MERARPLRHRSVLQRVGRLLVVLAHELAPTVMHRKYLVPRGRQATP